MQKQNWPLCMGEIDTGEDEHMATLAIDSSREGHVLEF